MTNTHWYNLRDFIFLSKEKKMGDNLDQILQNHQNQFDSPHDMVHDMNHMNHMNDEMHDGSANVHQEHDMMMMMYFYFGYENVQMIIKDWVQKCTARVQDFFFGFFLADPLAINFQGCISKCCVQDAFSYDLKLSLLCGSLYFPPKFRTGSLIIFQI